MSRPRGFIEDYNPRAKTRELLAQVEDVLEAYTAELPLTARKVLDRLVATVDYPKNENGYARLQEHLANFRRAGSVGFNVIRDDGATIESPLEWASPEHFLEIAEEVAREGQGVRLEGQPQWIEVWCEAAGMAPQLARAVGDYGVTVYSSGGFDADDQVRRGRTDRRARRPDRGRTRRGLRPVRARLVPGRGPGRRGVRRAPRD